MSRPRLALLGLHHESNTFAARPAGLDTFEAGGVLRGAEIMDRHASAHTTVSGFLDAAGELDVDVVPLLCANTNPCGPITAEAFTAIVGEMTSGLTAGLPWDGVLLAQHGAAVTDRHFDADAEILRRVRQVVGPRVPIGVALDMHANMGAAMVELATVCVGYLTNPHVDARVRGRRCAELVVGTMRGRIRPTTALARLPLLVNILRQNTGEPPMSQLVELAEKAMRYPGVLDVSLFEGFPYADVPGIGMSVAVLTDGDAESARVVAGALADEVWARRDDMQGIAVDPAQALAGAAERLRGGRTTLLLDVGDNIGGGSPGDSTALLAAALDIPGYFQTLCDPGAVRRCVATGPGRSLTLSVGGRAADSPALPVTVTGRVRTITDGRYEEPVPRHGGQRFFEAGTSVVLDVDTGPTLLLTTRLVPNTSLEQLNAAGVRPDGLGIVAAKGVHAPQAAFRPVVDTVVYVDTPGVTRASYLELPYRNRPVPMYPFEEAAEQCRRHEY